MQKDRYRDLLTKREAAMFYNLGLKKGLYVLEVAENLSPEERYYLIEALKDDIARSEAEYTTRLFNFFVQGEEERAIMEGQAVCP